MSILRETFLQRVRDALAEGARAGVSPTLEPRGSVGHQGMAPDPAAKFLDELALAGGRGYRVPTRERAADCVVDLVLGARAKRVLLGTGPVIDVLHLRDHLIDRRIEVESIDRLSTPGSRDVFFACDLAISGVDYLIAETGSLVILSSEGAPRSLSLLPPVHIAVAERSQIIPDLFDLFDGRLPGDARSMASCVSLITGPSKTGDIELRLVTGVHGPGELHVVLVAD